MGTHASGVNLLTFQETDEADNPTATYVYSEQLVEATSKRAAPTVGRVDVMHSSSPTSSWSTQSLVHSLSDIFLPAGFPHSVSDDYLPYQIFDSLQAFCSSIAGLLSSRAVLQGVGVGNASASPTSALLLHILQDSSGRVATILFAHRVGTALEPECKTYRLAADIFNDIAMILDCLSPMVPAGARRVTVLSTAGVLRALCGVAGGSSKASLSAHFSRWGNLAELNAKDSSQETIISLLGMLAGSVVVSHVSGFGSTWAALLLLLAFHLGLNYAAVRAVQMTSLNRQRANIIFSTLMDSDSDFDIKGLCSSSPDNKKTTTRTSSSSSSPENWSILTPAQVAQQELIFHRDGALDWTTQAQTHCLGTACIGISIPAFFFSSRSSNSSTKGLSFKTPIPMPQLLTLFTQESYLLFLSPSSRKWHASILLKKDSTPTSHLKAWAHALLAARVLCESGGAGAGYSTEEPHPVLGVVARTLAFLNEGSRFERYLAALGDTGWNVDIAALETSAGRRISS